MKQIEMAETKAGAGFEEQARALVEAWFAFADPSAEESERRALSQRVAAALEAAAAEATERAAKVLRLMEEALDGAADYLTTTQAEPLAGACRDALAAIRSSLRTGLGTRGAAGETLAAAGVPSLPEQAAAGLSAAREAEIRARVARDIAADDEDWRRLCSERGERALAEGDSIELFAQYLDVAEIAEFLRDREHIMAALDDARTNLAIAEAALAAERRLALEEAAKAMCRWCRDGYRATLYELKTSGERVVTHRHLIATDAVELALCAADPVHALIDAQAVIAVDRCGGVLVAREP